MFLVAFTLFPGAGLAHDVGLVPIGVQVDHDQLFVHDTRNGKNSIGQCDFLDRQLDDIWTIELPAVIGLIFVVPRSYEQTTHPGAVNGNFFFFLYDLGDFRPMPHPVASTTS